MTVMAFLNQVLQKASGNFGLVRQKFYSSVKSSKFKRTGGYNQSDEAHVYLCLTLKINMWQTPQSNNQKLEI